MNYMVSNIIYCGTSHVQNGIFAKAFKQPTDHNAKLRCQKLKTPLTRCYDIIRDVGYYEAAGAMRN